MLWRKYTVFRFIGRPSRRPVAATQQLFRYPAPPHRTTGYRNFPNIRMSNPTCISAPTNLTDWPNDLTCHVISCPSVDASWNVMTHEQKPDFVFRRNGRVHFNRRQFRRLLAAEVCASALIVGSNAGYTTFRGSEKSSGYPLHSPVSPSLPLPCVTACHHISIEVYLPHVLFQFQARSQNCAQRLLALLCLSVRLSIRPHTWKNSAPEGRLFMKFEIGVPLGNLSRKFKFH
jgi:hypothetical protein